MQVMLSDHHKESSNTANTEPRDNTIGQLMCELSTVGNIGVNWAEEMDTRGLQGEYYPPTNYSPSLHHTCQQTSHLPPHRQYNPPEPHYKPQHTPLNTEMEAEKCGKLSIKLSQHFCHFFLQKFAHLPMHLFYIILVISTFPQVYMYLAFSYL